MVFDFYNYFRTCLEFVIQCFHFLLKRPKSSEKTTQEEILFKYKEDYEKVSFHQGTAGWKLDDQKLIKRRQTLCIQKDQWKSAQKPHAGSEFGWGDCARFLLKQAFLSSYPCRVYVKHPSIKKTSRECDGDLAFNFWNCRDSTSR